MYLLQCWFNLSDEGVEDAVYDSYLGKLMAFTAFTTGIRQRFKGLEKYGFFILHAIYCTAFFYFVYILCLFNPLLHLCVSPAAWFLSGCYLVCTVSLAEA